MRLTSRILRTYLAVYGVVASVGFIAVFAAYASVSGTTDVGRLGVAVGVLGVGIIVVLVAVPLVSTRLGLGGGTAVGLLAMILPVLFVGVLTKSGIATLVVALVWPLGVALVVHGRRDHRHRGPRARHRAVERLRAVVGEPAGPGPSGGPLGDEPAGRRRPPVLCPPANDDVKWAGVWPGPFSEVTYEVAQGAHRYEVDLDNQRPQPDLEAIEDKVQPLANGPHERNSVLLRRRLKGPTWITVSAQERVEKDAEHPEGWRSAPKAGDAFAESLVACSPKELAAQSGPR